MLKGRDDLVEAVTNRSSDGLFQSVGRVFDGVTKRPACVGELISLKPACDAKGLCGGIDDVGTPAARLGVAPEGHPDPQLGEDVHLDGGEAARGADEDVAVTAVFSNEFARPPEPTDGSFWPPLADEGTEERSADCWC